MLASSWLGGCQDGPKKTQDGSKMAAMASRRRKPAEDATQVEEEDVCKAKMSDSYRKLVVVRR